MVNHGHLSDKELREIYYKYAYAEGDDITAIGRGLADAVSARVKTSGKTLEEWLKGNKSHKASCQYSKQKISEEEIAKKLCDCISHQHIPLRDASLLIKKVLSENHCHSIYFNGEKIPLSKARGDAIVLYAESLINHYHLPFEHVEI